MVCGTETVHGLRCAVLSSRMGWSSRAARPPSPVSPGDGVEVWVSAALSYPATRVCCCVCGGAMLLRARWYSSVVLRCHAHGSTRLGYAATRAAVLTQANLRRTRYSTGARSASTTACTSRSGKLPRPYRP
eukprot:3852900-Rhodomonas_salina.2